MRHSLDLVWTFRHQFGWLIFCHCDLGTQYVLLINVIFYQLDSIDFENNPELKKLQFLAPGPKMAGVTKGTLLPKQEVNIKEGEAMK